LEQVRIQVAETQRELAEANAHSRGTERELLVEKYKRVPKRKRIEEEGGTTKLNLQESVDTETTQPLEVDEPSALPPKTLSIPNPEPLNVPSTMPSTVPDPHNLKRSEAVMGLSNRISRYRDKIKTATRQEHIRTGKIALIEYNDNLAAKREAQRVKDGLAPGQEGPIMQLKRG
jgi:hypothetical protein